MGHWVVFDAMGVVFEVGDDTNDLLVPFVQQYNDTSRERINELYIEASLGRKTSEQFWREVGLGAYYPDIETEYLNTRLTVDKDFCSVAGRLADRFCLGLLSNDVPEWSAHLRRRYSLDFFDVVVVSGLVGYRKPDGRIYEIFLKQAKAAPDSCILVDDRYRNLRTAKELGFKTVHFERTPADAGDFAPDACIKSFSELEDRIQRIW
jgi:putative hydrolase of the HAD superfamily